MQDMNYNMLICYHNMFTSVVFFSTKTYNWGGLLFISMSIHALKNRLIEAVL